MGEVTNEWAGNKVDVTGVTADTVLTPNTKDAEEEKAALDEGAIGSISETVLKVTCETVKVVLLLIIGIPTVINISLDIGVTILLSERD